MRSSAASPPSRVSQDIYDRTLAVDVGGTFTDVVLWDGTTCHRQGCRAPRRTRAGGGGRGRRCHGGADRLLHGTTVATNALLEAPVPARPFHQPRVRGRTRDRPSGPPVAVRPRRRTSRCAGSPRPADAPWMPTSGSRRCRGGGRLSALLISGPVGEVAAAGDAVRRHPSGSCRCRSRARSPRVPRVRRTPRPPCSTPCTPGHGAVSIQAG